MLENILKSQGPARSFSNIILACLLGIFVSACGGGGGGGSSGGPDIAEGRFFDSPVEGLGYSSGSISGVTDASGTFQYEVGQSVSFFIGGIQLGTITPADIITPIELVSGATDENHPIVINILRFLQTLDQDGNPDNGIMISDVVTGLAADAGVDFSLSVEDFAANGDIQILIAELTGADGVARLLVDIAAAQEHFRETLANLMSDPPPPGPTNTLTLTGDDAATYGNELVLTEFAYGRGDLTGLEQSLIATNDNVLQAITDGIVDEDAVANGIVFISSAPGISMRINVNGVSGLYLLGCTDISGTATPCDEISFNVANRTITFTDAVVQPSTSSENVLGTAPMTINGQLEWTAADEP